MVARHAGDFQMRGLAQPHTPRHLDAAQGPQCSRRPKQRGDVSFQSPPRPPGRTRPGGSNPPVNLPRTVGILIGANVVVYLLQTTMPPAWANWVVFHLGFVPARWSIEGAWDWSALVGPVSHQFLHGGLAHLFVNMIMLAAFGSGVERVLGGRRLLILFLLSGIAGAALHYGFYSDSSLPVVGASGAISGLFGAILRLMAKNPQVSGGFARILPVVGIWIAIAVITGFTGLPGSGEAQVAWAAHVGGFLFTFLLLDFFTIGAWPRRVD